MLLSCIQILYRLYMHVVLCMPNLIVIQTLSRLVLRYRRHADEFYLRVSDSTGTDDGLMVGCFTS